jgi:hypothetical protein
MAMEVQVEHQKKDQGPKGLKRLRAGWIGQPKPDYQCPNCKCSRYSKCYCPVAKEGSDGDNKGPVGNNEGQ